MKIQEVTSNVAITVKQEKLRQANRDTGTQEGTFLDKATLILMVLLMNQFVVQCDVQILLQMIPNK